MIQNRRLKTKWIAGVLTLALAFTGMGTAVAAAPTAFAAESAPADHALQINSHVLLNLSEPGSDLTGLISETQKNLNTLGYRCDNTEGILTEETQAAITEFQKVHQLEQTGTADSNTEKKLTEAVKAHKAAEAEEKKREEAAAKKKAAAERAAKIENINKARLTIPADAWLLQTMGDNCTISSCTILLRANSFLKGGDYQSISIDAVSAVGWGWQGCQYSFGFDGEQVMHADLSGSAEEREATVRKMLEERPEGIVLYGWGGPDGSCHAFYANLDKDGSFRTLDPANQDLANRYVAFEDSWAASCRDWNYIQAVWYLE